MCLPAAAMAALAVASTAADVFSEVQSAKAQNKAISEQLQQGESQVQQQEVADINARSREARKEQARMMVAAGEAGLQPSSGSVENMLIDSSMQNELAAAGTRLNAEHQDQSLIAQANRAYSNVQMPTVVGAGLRLASAGASGYDKGRSISLAKQAISRPAANQTTGR